MFTLFKIPSLLVVSLLLITSLISANQPNIIVIYMDDLGYNDIGIQTSPNTTDYYPNSGPEPQPDQSEVGLPEPNEARLLTPAIDSLAAEGLRMSSFYTTRLCSPSRASLLTGRYAARQSMSGVFFPNSNDGFNTNEVTLPEQLRELGYSTAMVGKWHLGYNDSQTLSFQMMPTRHGFQKFFGFPYSNDMSNYHLIEDEEIIQADLGGGEKNQTKLTWMLTEKALEHIETSTAEDKPFFLYFAHPMTHIPCWPSNQEFQNADGTIWPIFKGSSGVSYYYDVVKEVDHSVERILDKVKDLGVDEDTLIVFTSDNGPWLNLGSKNFTQRSVGSAYPLRNGKFTTWDGGVRVPFLVRWPNQIPAGTVSDEVAGVIDLLPTLVSLGGGAPHDDDRTIDGIDLWSLWSGAVSALDRSYAMFDNNVQGMRKGKWKLRAGALYDLENDIQELNDVSGVSANSSVLTELEALKASLQSSVNSEKEPKGAYTNYEIEFSGNDIMIDEGATATVDIRLSHNPGANLTVSLVHFSGDADISITTGSSLDFTTSNWSEWQTVTFAADVDADTLNEGATFRATMSEHSVVRELFVHEVDSEAPEAVNAVLEWPKVDSLLFENTESNLLVEGSLNLGSISNPAESTFRWIKVSGPGDVAFTDSSASRTGVSFESAGVYKLRLYADHPTAGSFDTSDFSVNVIDAGSSIPTSDYKYIPILAYNGISAVDGDSAWNNTTFLDMRDWVLADSVSLTASDPAAQLSFIDAALTFSGGALPAGGSSENLSNYANSDGSIELWFKPSVLPITAPQVLWETGGDIGASFTLDGSQIRFTVDDSGSSVANGAVAAAPLAPSATRDGFIHCVGVIDLTNDQIKLYLDGSLVDTQAIPSVSKWSGISQCGLGTIVNTRDNEVSSNSELGGNNQLSGSFSPYIGQIAHMLFYDRALTAMEVADLTISPFEETDFNIAATVVAGSDQSVAYSVGAALHGSIDGEGSPIPNDINLAWTLSEGPAVPVFADTNSASTHVDFSLPGVYQLWLEADDGEIKVYDEIQITVGAYSYNEWKQGISFPVSEDALTDNPDGDPWNNGWEWLFGSDPLVYNASQSFSNSITSTNAETLSFRFEFIVPRNRKPDLFLQSTQGLSLSWAKLEQISPTIEIIDESTERWSFVIDVDLSDASDYFVRSMIDF